jgi:hypothetical protein
MQRTFISVTLMLIALFLTWILQRIFKLKLTGQQFGFIAVLIFGLLIPVWFFCPAVWHFWGPR